jgi:adenylylsulfate kinase
MTTTGAEALLIAGGLATGKTTVATAVGELLEERGVAGGVVDLDWLCWAWSPRLDHQSTHRLLCDNLRLVTPRLLAEGLDRLVLCRAVLAPADVDGIRDAVGLPLKVVRLTVAADEAERRLRRRDTGDELRTHLAELPTFALAAAEATGDAAVVDTTGRAASDIATELLRLIGWADVTARDRPY